MSGLLAQWQALSVDLQVVLAVAGVVLASLSWVVAHARGLRVGRRLERASSKRTIRRKAEEMAQALEPSDAVAEPRGELTLDDLMPVAAADVEALLLRLETDGLYSESISRKQWSWHNSVLDAYVGQAVLDRLTESRGERAVLAGHLEIAEPIEASVLFLDLRGFTSATENLGATYVMRLLNAYLRQLAEVVVFSGGTVDKFIGDNIMATFGVPRRTPHSAQDAFKCARAMVERMAEINNQLAESGLPSLKPSIGIATGNMIAGTLGGVHRRDFTVIGAPVNLASRLEHATRGLHVPVLIDNATYKALSEPPDMKVHHAIHLRGMAEPVLGWSWTPPGSTATPQDS
jgi:class 3 adenylate cyclase